MLDIQQYPKALRFIGHGSVILLNGVEFRLEIVEGQIEKVFLTARDPDLKPTVMPEYKGVHVRVLETNRAVFTREDLIELIRSGNFYIG